VLDGRTIWGYRSSSCTRMLSNLMLRNLCGRLPTRRAIDVSTSGQPVSGAVDRAHWSTDLSCPVMARSFLSSTVSSWS
jgi:hypothetical protein